MKVLIFSDTHLTDNFEEKKFNFLKKIISRSDKVIINGDFWDGYLTTFDKFISSPWKKLFPLLKSKKTVYVCGNHDRFTYADKRINLFSVKQVTVYYLKNKNYKLIIEHGHKIYRTIDEKLPRKVNKYLSLAAGFFLNYFPLTRLLLKMANSSIKNRVKNKRIKGEVLIYGHTHYAEKDINNKFVNTGSIENGIAEYVLIENGEIISVKERYS